MPFENLQNYISLLEQHDQLARISAPVDPLLEIAAITDRVCKQPGGGRALLFEQPYGSRFAVATNLFGSLKRICLALEIDHPDRLRVRLRELLDKIPEIDFPNLDRQLAGLPEFSRFAAIDSTEADQELVTAAQPDLTLFPFLQSWLDDGSACGHKRYITLPQVFTTFPDGNNPNCGLYRVQIRGPRELAIQWKTGSGAARQAAEFRSRGETMPVAIMLGGDPAMLFSAMLPLPGNLDETAFAGFLRGEPLRTATCGTVPLRVPTGAEVVIEGYVEAGATVTEGPFGNHTGCYSPAAPAALMRVTAIRHRPDAIVPATVVGPPPMEDCWMAVAWERLLLAFLQKLLPELADIHFPLEWVFHQSAIISLENPRPGMVREMAEKLWLLPWFAAARILVFVDAACGPLEIRRAAWQCINLLEYRHDLIHDAATGRTALDATGCRSPQNRTETDQDIARLVGRRWREYGLA
ncbi:MAG: UbiD family decarboxylase [Pseudomonadota bacterium]